MRDRIEKISFALDLGFSDYYPGENVRELTISRHIESVERAVTMMRIEEGINYSLFESFGAKHPAAEIYRLDFPSDLRASLYLLLGGYYRQSVLCLRSWLEMRLLAVYFGFAEKEVSKYPDWKLGKLDQEESPFGRRLIRRLFGEAEFERANAAYSLRQRLEDLYGELSGLAHGAGLEKHDLQADTDNVPRYNSRSADLWFQLLTRVFPEVVFCLFTAYGDSILPGLLPDERSEMLALLPAPYQAELRPSMDQFANDA
jgi:hypothetical protein